MSDEADRAGDLTEAMIEAEIARLREAAALIEAGCAGECDLCGEWSGRLIGGACAACRDRWGLP